jgi:hypothetical protein
LNSSLASSSEPKSTEFVSLSSREGLSQSVNRGRPGRYFTGGRKPFENVYKAWLANKPPLAAQAQDANGGFTPSGPGASEEPSKAAPDGESDFGAMLANMLNFTPPGVAKRENKTDSRKANV